jgi:YVTN family beta-propeller protein
MPRVVGPGILAVATLLLVGLLGRDMAAPATAQTQSAPGVPVFQAQAGPPPPGTTVPATTIVLTPRTAPVVDLGRLGLPRAAGVAPPPRPATGVIGTSNAYMSISPDRIPASTACAAGVVASGFTPGETADFYFNGSPAFSQDADSFGFLDFCLPTGPSTGVLTIQATGRTSGKSAGSVAQVVSGPTVPGLAFAPHAVNRNGTAVLTALATGFPPNTTVTFARNGGDPTTVNTGANGAAGLVFIYLNQPVPDGAVVYSVRTGTAGQFAGQSIEERVDAGTGDQNATRAFFDRAVFNSAVSSTVALVGEGFQAGETVTVSGCTSETLAADARGAVRMFLGAGGTGVNQCVLTGTSGRVGRAAAQGDALAPNVAAAIASPAHLAVGGGSFTFLFDGLAANESGTILIDGVSQGAASTNASGYGSVPLTAPSAAGIHAVQFVGSSGDAAIAPLYVVAAPPTPTPTITHTPTTTRTPTTTPTSNGTPTGTPTPLPVNCVGCRLFVSNASGNGVSVYDVQGTPTVLPTLPTGIGNYGVATQPDGKRLFVAKSGGVSVYDIQGTPFALPTLPAGNGPVGVAVQPDGKRLFVTNINADSVSVYDIQGTPSVLPTLPAGSGPFAVAVAGGPIATRTPTATPTATHTATNTSTPTSTSTATSTAISTSTATSAPTSTPTTTPSSTDTPTATPTSTSTPTATNTPAPTSSPTVTPTSTRTPTSTATPTSTPPPTGTAIALATSTPTATPAPATGTPTATPVPAPCAPRPPVGVAAVPNGDGRLHVTLTANTNAGTPTNALASVQVTTGANALVYTGLLVQQAPFTVTLPPGTTSTTLYLGRLTPGQASSASLVVTDGCGAWPTFVGGGPSAF